MKLSAAAAAVQTEQVAVEAFVIRRFRFVIGRRGCETFLITSQTWTRENRTSSLLASRLHMPETEWTCTQSGVSPRGIEACRTNTSPYKWPQLRSDNACMRGKVTERQKWGWIPAANMRLRQHRWRDDHIQLPQLNLASVGSGPIESGRVWNSTDASVALHDDTRQTLNPCGLLCSPSRHSVWAKSFQLSARENRANGRLWYF